MRRTTPRRERTRKPHPTLKKALRMVLIGLAALLMVALFYLAVILAQPEEAENAVTVLQDQPLYTASPALNIEGESQLMALAEAFPVPILTFMEGMGPKLVRGSSFDQSFEGGFARRTELTYRTDNGLEFTLTTLYPARALALMGKGDYTLTGLAAQNLTGLAAIRMENQGHIRLHAQASDAVYVLTAPQMADESLTAVTRALQRLSPGD